MSKARSSGARLTIMTAAPEGRSRPVVEAAAAAGARGILVPTPVTRRAEVQAAARRAATVTEAVEQVLAGRW